MSEHVQIERTGAIVTIRMARPDKKNAITTDMYRGMTVAFSDATHDPGVRAIMLAGAGGSFTSGNDLRDFASAPPLDDDIPAFQFLREIAQCPKPIVAAVSGVAVGIGTTMLLHCDLVVADPATRFSLPFINLGLVPEGASSLILPRMIGHVKASELLMLGDMFDAVTAERCGIINRISAAGEADGVAMGWAEALAAKAPNALRATKALLKSETTGVLTRIREEGQRFAPQLHSEEFREALMAYTEKRAPRYT
ncbi:MAG: enoyl-CoA hydratase [Gemmatimonadaceae bacterium]|nr:enoyl-CoA hydratase [Gemmatimonadaceae bacterium]